MGVSARSRNCRWHEFRDLREGSLCTFLCFCFLHMKSDIFTIEFHITRWLAWDLLGEILSDFVLCCFCSVWSPACRDPLASVSQVLGWQDEPPPPLALCSSFRDVPESSCGIIFCFMCPELSHGTTCSDLRSALRNNLGETAVTVLPAVRHQSPGLSHLLWSYFVLWYWCLRQFFHFPKGSLFPKYIVT